MTATFAPDVAPAPPLLPQVHHVVRTRRWTHDTVTIWLEAPEGHPVPWNPGQFSMLSVPGIGESAISISGTDQHSRHAYTIRAVGGVTNALSAMKTGDRVGFRGPFGTAWPLAQARGHDLVFVAGGLGLAPLRAALAAALDERDAYGRVVVLIGARTPGELLFKDELLGWAGRDDVEVEITVDRAADEWQGRVGLVTRFLPTLTVDADTAVAMVCGPEVMMRVMGWDLLDVGLKADRIHLSLERTMRCGVGWCGHCQLGPKLVCRDGPIFPHSVARRLMEVKEL